jgi:replication factor C subunit 3/5
MSRSVSEPPNISFTEKYRPTSFNDMVMESTTRTIFNNILKTKQIPNLILHGPPGTGKTTAIVNLKRCLYSSSEIKELTIHLNASDDRGVDVVRKQISLFVKSKNMFYQGCKLLILDEFDSATPTAQRELISIITSYAPSANISTILMCNFYSKLDPVLTEYFVRIPFSFLDKDPVIDMIRKICEKETIDFDADNAATLYEYYDNDIRSILNHIQTNGSLAVISDKIIGRIHQSIIGSGDIASVELVSEKLTHVCATLDINISDFIHHHIKWLQTYHLDFFMKHIDDFKYELIHCMEDNDVSQIWFHVSLLADLA